jgi:hypothetical protein
MVNQISPLRCRLQKGGAAIHDDQADAREMPVVVDRIAGDLKFDALNAPSTSMRLRPVDFAR